jgi:hypothetical protein
MMGRSPIQMLSPDVRLFFPEINQERAAQERSARRDSMSAKAASSAALRTLLEVRSERMRSRCRSSSCFCRSRCARSRSFFLRPSALETARSADDCCSSTDLLSQPLAISIWYVNSPCRRCVRCALRNSTNCQDSGKRVPFLPYRNPFSCVTATWCQNGFSAI